MLEHVSKLLTKARMRVARRAGGEESEAYPRYVELYESFPAQPVTCARSRQEF